MAQQANGSRTPALRGSNSTIGEQATNATGNLESFAQATWLDPCWIHQGCADTPGYSDTGSMGPGWYCSDGVYVDANTAYDLCAIHSSCSCGVKYVATWICNC